jgi:poly(A) polymerase
MTEEILKRLKFSGDEITIIVDLVATHMKFVCVKDMRVAKRKRFLRDPNIERRLELHRLDCVASHGSLEHYNFCAEQLKELKATPEKFHPIRIITGHDLIELGYTPGPVFSEILDTVEDMQLEGTITNREQAVKFVMERWEIPEKLKED